MATATYKFEVDWSNDGDWSDTGEDVTSRVRAREGVRWDRGRDQIRALSPPMAGRSDFTLDNRSKDYSPEYASGPLYGNLLPGRKVRIRTTAPSAATLFTGFLDDLPQHPLRTQRSVDAPALGPLSRLRGVKVSTGLYTNITTGVALGHLLTAAGWPLGDRTLSTGQTDLLYWWCDEDDAFDMAVTLLNTEGPGATLYESGDGKIVFEDRHYRQLTARSTTSQATFRDSGAEPLMSDFAYQPHLRDIINAATLTVAARTAEAEAVVWQLGGTLSLGASQAIALVARSSHPFSGATTPVATTDYTVLTGSVASVSLSRTSGASTVVTVTAGAGGATIADLQLRATSYEATETLLSNTVDASASIAKYGLRPYRPSIWPDVVPDFAVDTCNVLVQRYSEPRATVRVELNSAQATRLTQQLTREISDRVTVVEAQTGLNADCFIEHIAHEVQLAGKLHRTIFGLEKASTDTLLVVDSADAIVDDADAIVEY